MIEIAIMIEGQDGLTWPRWQSIARIAEDLGFTGLYRSDHMAGSRGPDKDSLDLWPSLTWLAGHTQRIEFGPLVTPFSFRHPVHTARMACAVDDLSGGRLTLGLGAGWNQYEHDKFGFDLLPLPRRMARFAEGMEVVSSLLHSDEPVTFAGEFYNLREAVALPRPARTGGPPILVGGSGPKRTMPLAAQYAREWNCIYKQPDEFVRLSAYLDSLLQERGRDPKEVRRSMMTGLAYGRTAAEVERKAEIFGPTVAEARARGAIVGGADEAVERLGALAEAGVQRVMMQWLDLDDMAGLEAFGRDVLPQVGA